jgi:lysophospholipase L1-like esterase
MNNAFKTILMMVISVCLTLVVFFALYEMISSYQYDKWRAEYSESGDWYGNLTVESDNKTLVWGYRPNAVGGKWNTRISTNSSGFRDREHAPEKNAGALRLAFVGDSTTVGVGVEQEDIYVRHFEEKAAQILPGREIEALSFAVDGYSALQVMELIRARALGFSPDIVVYVMCMNDFDFYYSSGGKLDFFRKPDSFFLNMLEKSYIKLSGVNYYSYHFAKNQQEVLARIDAVNSELAGLGIEFKVALLPIFYERAGDISYPHGAIFDDINQSLSAAGIGVLDLREKFISQNQNPRTFAADTLHMNAAGHEFVAGELLTELGNLSATED